MKKVQKSNLSIHNFRYRFDCEGINLCMFFLCFLIKSLRRHKKVTNFTACTVANTVQSLFFGIFNSKRAGSLLG
jgi:hypothetical protein